MHRGLASRICSANDVNVFVFTGGGFGDRRAVINAGAGEAIHTWDIETTPLHSGRDDHAVRREFLPVRELHDSIFAFDKETDGFGGSEHFGSEPAHLCDAAAGEIGSAKSGGKAEIVFDARAEAGLATRGFALHENRLQSFGAAVESTRKSGGSGADNDHVIETAAGN